MRRLRELPVCRRRTASGPAHRRTGRRRGWRGETGRVDRRRSHSCADALGGTDEPPRRRQGRVDRPGRTNERGSGECTAEDARRAACQHVLHPGIPSGGPLAGDDRKPLPANRRAAAHPRRRARMARRAGPAAGGPPARAGKLRATGRTRARRCRLSRRAHRVDDRAVRAAIAVRHGIGSARRRRAARRAQGSPRRGDRLACSPGAPTWRVSTPAVHPSRTRISVRSSRRWPDRWRRYRSFVIIAACCSNARSSRTRCNRVSSPRRS